MSSYTLTYDSDRLIREWRERYTDRRTVAREMLDQAELLVRDAVVLELQQQARAARDHREMDLERRERQLEETNRRHEQRVDRLQRELAEAKERIASMSPRQTLMREERETIEDGTIVRIQAPTVPSYGDGTAVRPWMLGEIEEVAQRLRMAGGDDQTEVRFKKDAVESCVPFPEFVLTPASRPVPALPDPGRDPGRELRWSPRTRAGLLALALVVLVAALVVGVVL